MKKTLLILSLTLFTFISHAQFEIRNYDDDSIVTDGETLSFSDTGCGYTDSCNWRFKVTNTSATETLNMRIYVDNMVNSDGSNVQLCFSGTCLNSVSLGTGYPTSTPASIAPGASTGPGNYFWNQNPVGTSTVMEWTLRFQALDGSGTPTGTPLSVTYRFDPNLSIEEQDLNTVEIFPTQVKNELTVSSNKDLTAEFYDILGKKVKQVNILAGGSQVDVSDLSSQLYIIRFISEEGNISTQKIVVE